MKGSPVTYPTWPVTEKPEPVTPDDKDPSKDFVPVSSPWVLDHYASAELLLLDITFLGLLQGPWDFSRGARTERKYYNETGDIVVRDAYTYVMDASNKSIVSVKRHIEWYNSDASVKVSKDITPSMDVKKIKQLNRDVRQGRIDYLESAAEDMRSQSAFVPEPIKSQLIMVADMMDAMFLHYETEVTRYVSRGTTDLEDAVNSETDPTILTTLGITTPIGWTVKESIIYQITGVAPNV